HDALARPQADHEREPEHRHDAEGEPLELALTGWDAGADGERRDVRPQSDDRVGKRAHCTASRIAERAPAGSSAARFGSSGFGRVRLMVSDPTRPKAFFTSSRTRRDSPTPSDSSTLFFSLNSGTSGLPSASASHRYS